MPGAYAHMTLVNHVGVSQNLDTVPDFPKQAALAVNKFSKFSVLGAVSPDYPYLALFQNVFATEKGKPEHWANAMHLDDPGDFIKAAITIVRGMNGIAQQKATAWLLGYTSHFGADITIHPVINAKVGPYEQNKKAHRICEMNQDTYIWQRIDLGNLGVCEYINSHIRSCSDKENPKLLDADIEGVWNRALEQIYPKLYAEAPPNIHSWHQAFMSLVNIVEESGRLPALSRHVLVGGGATYPLISEIDEQFIKALPTPTEKKIDYDDLFVMAQQNITNLWRLVAKGIFEGDTEYLIGIDNWSLDTGHNLAGEYAFWDVKRT